MKSRCFRRGLSIFTMNVMNPFACVRAIKAETVSLAHDVMTAGFSVGDVALDVLVCMQFYATGDMSFFWASIIVFAAAQVTYAFLFTATFAEHRPVSGRLLVFACVLPLAQLIPVFTWIESCDVPRLHGAMRSLGLRPSLRGCSRERASSDSLWLLFKAKVGAHAGFLAEALVEAVPQCALQTAHAVLVGRLSAVGAASILLSVSVIASKSWVLSYSLHRPTLALNSLAIGADVCALFANICWLCAATAQHSTAQHSTAQHSIG